jgi:enamine deaminase RidA (YjgF/YER057c/UK114 family)
MIAWPMHAPHDDELLAVGGPATRSPTEHGAVVRAVQEASLRPRADRDAVTAARIAFFGDHPPPHTGIIIAGLGSPEVRVEVEVIAYLPARRG